MRGIASVRRAGIALAVAAIVGVAGVALTFFGRGGTLASPDEYDGDLRLSVEQIEPSDRGTLLTYRLCVDGSFSPIQVQRVQPVDAEGLRIDRFAVLTSRSDQLKVRGWTAQPISRLLPRSALGSTVSARCEERRRPFLAVQIRSDDDGRLATMRGIDVFHDGRDSPLRLPLDLQICRDTIDTPTCPPQGPR